MEEISQFFGQCKDYLSGKGNLVDGTAIGPSYTLHLFRSMLVNLFGDEFQQLEMHYDTEANRITIYFQWGFWQFWFWYIFRLRDRAAVIVSADQFFKNVRLDFKRQG